MPDPHTPITVELSRGCAQRTLDRFPEEAEGRRLFPASDDQLELRNALRTALEHPQDTARSEVELNLALHRLRDEAAWLRTHGYEKRARLVEGWVYMESRTELEPWEEAAARELADSLDSPAPTQQEEKPRCGTEDGLRQIAVEFREALGGPQFEHDPRIFFLRALADRYPPCPDCKGEEDWPEVVMRRTGPDAEPFRFLGDYPTLTPQGETRRYIPAPDGGDQR